MSKQTLRKYITDKTGITNDEAEIIFNVVIESIITELLEKRKSVVQNFGTFYVKQVQQRTARNPKTGETVIVPTKKVVRFKPANKLKDSVFNLKEI